MTSDDDDDDDITPSKPNRLSEQTGMAAEACKKIDRELQLWIKTSVITIIVIIVQSVYVKSDVIHIFIRSLHHIFACSKCMKLLMCHSAWL